MIAKSAMHQGSSRMLSTEPSPRHVVRKAPLLPVGPRRRGYVPTVYDPAVQNAASEVWSAVGGVSAVGVSVVWLAKLIREANYDPDSSYYCVNPAAAAATEPTLTGTNTGLAALHATEAVDNPVLINIAETSTELISEPCTAAQQSVAGTAEIPTQAPTAAQAAAVLEELTADAPVGATPVSRVMGSDNGNDGTAPAGNVGKMTVEAPASAAMALSNDKQLSDTSLAAEPTSSSVATAVAENKIENALEEYEARLNRILKQSAETAQQRRRMQQQGKAAPVAAQQKVAAPSQGYQVKIDSLWQTYEKKKQQEEARLQRSEKILLDLAAVEEANKDGNKLSSPTRELWQRVVAFIAAIRAWVAHVISQLFAAATEAVLAHLLDQLSEYTYERVQLGLCIHVGKERYMKATGSCT